jgi:hypothetical protein
MKANVLSMKIYVSVGIINPNAKSKVDVVMKYLIVKGKSESTTLVKLNSLGINLY